MLGDGDWYFPGKHHKFFVRTNHLSFLCWLKMILFFFLTVKVKGEAEKKARNEDFAGDELDLKGNEKEMTS